MPGMSIRIILSKPGKGIDLLVQPRVIQLASLVWKEAMTKHSFTIDWEKRMVTCPMGRRSMFWKEGVKLGTAEYPLPVLVVGCWLDAARHHGTTRQRVSAPTFTVTIHARLLITTPIKTKRKRNFFRHRFRAW